MIQVACIPHLMCTEIVMEVGMMAVLGGLHCFKGNFLVCSRWIQDSSL